MRTGLLVVLCLSALPTGAQAQGTGKRFDECAFPRLPCQSSVIAEGTTDTCIAVHSPGLKSMYVDGITLVRIIFGISSYRQSSFYAGSPDKLIQVSKDKPLCLCRIHDGYDNEIPCDAKSLEAGRYGVYLNIFSIEDMAGNRNFQSTIGVAEFQIDAGGRVTSQPADKH